MNQTFVPFYSEPQERIWYLINAEGKTLGRLSTHVSYLLQGKNKINFYPSADMGNFVIIINAKKIFVTGSKEKQKLYYKHSGRPGGMKIENLRSLRNRSAKTVLEKSIKKMLPKTVLGRTMFTRLKVFNDSECDLKFKNTKLIKI